MLFQGVGHKDDALGGDEQTSGDLTGVVLAPVGPFMPHDALVGGQPEMPVASTLSRRTRGSARTGVYEGCAVIPIPNCLGARPPTPSCLVAPPCEVIAGLRSEPCVFDDGSGGTRRRAPE